jgi:RNA-splicing ligase RtcB
LITELDLKVEKELGSSSSLSQENTKKIDDVMEEEAEESVSESK